MRSRAIRRTVLPSATSIHSTVCIDGERRAAGANLRRRRKCSLVVVVLMRPELGRASGEIGPSFAFVGVKGAMKTAIRPDLLALRRMPTIHRVAESWGKLELKLETVDTRYWLTTEGVAR